MTFIDYDPREFDEYVEELHSIASVISVKKRMAKSPAKLNRLGSVMIDSDIEQDKNPQFESESNKSIDSHSEFEDVQLQLIHHPFKPGAENNNVRNDKWTGSHLQINDVIEFKRKLPSKLFREQNEFRSGHSKNADAMKEKHFAEIEKRQLSQKEQNK